MIKLSRRGLAAAAAVAALGAGTATWAATSASAATGHPERATTARTAGEAGYIPRCTAGDLAVWVNANSGDGAAGTIYYHLEYTNISGGTCHLYSYPGVSAVNAAGQQLGAPATRDAAVPAAYVNIPAGGTAHSVLGYVDAQLSASCKPRAAAALKVFPPDDQGARTAFFSLPVCTTKTADLKVERVQPGA